LFSNKLKISFALTYLLFFSTFSYAVDSTPTSSASSATSVASNQAMSEEKFFLEKGLIDISVVFSSTFRSSQQIISIGAQGGYFISDIFEVGLKISTESFHDYDLITEFGLASRLFFLKKSSSLPFLNLEAGYAYGRKLSGFFVRGGIGLLQHVKGIFNIFIVACAELWIFTYRYNQDTGLANAQVQTYFEKYHNEYRVIFGLSFMFNRKD
jgi:hypothetical protein